MTEGQKENTGFGNWENRSNQDKAKTPKLLSLWEAYLCSHMFKLHSVHTLRRLTDNIKFVFAKIKFHFQENNQDDGERVDLIKKNLEMKEEEGLARLVEEEEQVRKKMREEENLVKNIGGGHKENKKKKKKNTGGAAEVEKGRGYEQKMRAWRKKMLRRMG